MGTSINMMHTTSTTNPMLLAAFVVTFLVSLIAFNPSLAHAYTHLYGYTTHHHGQRLLFSRRFQSNRNPNNSNINMHSTTRLHMSTPSDNNDDNEPNYYEILGARQDASRSELKKKYIELARISHPDAQLSKNNAFVDDEKKKKKKKNVDFQIVTEAWRTLGNPKSRRRYDRKLKAKAWGEAAQRLTNERLEQVAPLASSFMDNLAVPFLRKTSATVGKAIQKGAAVAEAISSTEESESIPKTSNGSPDKEATTVNEQSDTAVVDKNITSATPNGAFEVEPIEETKVQEEPNGAKSTIPEQTNDIANSISQESAVDEPTDEMDEDTPDAMLNEKSRELEEQVKTQEERAKTIHQEYDSIKEKRLFASLQSPEYTLTSCEAEEVLEKLNDKDTVSFVNRATKQTSIKKDILSLRNTEEEFTEKLETYTEIDREWNTWLDKQETAKKTLRENKQKEFEARRALTTAEEMVSKANTDVIAVSNKLRGVEQEVRRSAEEMDRVSTSLSRKQEKVQNALRRKTELMKGGISVEYVTAEEVKLLRQQESQLLGESKQIATMVAKLQSRADQLKKRAEALEKLKNK